MKRINFSLAKVVSFLVMFFVVVAAAVGVGSYPCYANDYGEEYGIGKKIAEGVSLSVVTGLAAMDPDLKYSIETKNSTFSYQGNTWPILDVIIDTESRKIGNNKITFVLLMEVDQKTQVIVGTVKNVKVNGNLQNNFSLLNNTMYIETEEGTEQVQVVNGVLRYVE